MSGEWGSTSHPPPVSCQKRPVKVDLNKTQSLITILKMSRIHLKSIIIPRTKKVSNERKQPTDTDTEMTQIWNYLTKILKQPLQKKCLYGKLWPCLKQNKKVSTKKHIKNNQIEILELKNTMIKIKNLKTQYRWQNKKENQWIWRQNDRNYLTWTLERVKKKKWTTEAQRPLIL